MSFKFVRQLPSPDQVKEQTLMSEEMKKNKGAERPSDPGCDHRRF